MPRTRHPEPARLLVPAAVRPAAPSSPRFASCMGHHAASRSVTTARNAVHAQRKPIFASHEALRWQSRCVAAVGARGPPTPGAALVLGVLLGGPPCSRVLVRNTGPSRPGPAEDQGCSRAASAPCSVTKTRHLRVPHTRSACSLGPADLRPGTAEGHGRGSRALWSEPCGSRALWEPCRGGHACPATGRPPRQRAAPP